jgi:malate dehydrogenase (oxaloacetate-decarboxylating)(NADP+)
VISNGTAVLGLGDLGALASKPVMEGKAVLFKRFADVDGFDLEVDTRDVDEFVNCVRFLGPSFGGINLEDIKAPDCFIIEARLRELLDIPVFHDDQHGTAIIAAAGLINALELTGRNIREVRLVLNGAGAAAIASVELFKSLGVPAQNIILCDSKGVVWQGRTEGMNQWKAAHAVDTPHRTLADAVRGADVFIGLSVKGAMTQDMVRSMADKPIVFALANPDPEIAPDEVKAVRSDAIIATGRSDYPNQINNVLGFPYIFRGALDVRASTINEAMKLAAAHALARLARQDVPDEVDSAYSGRRLRYGLIFDKVASAETRVVFAEGEEERTIRAAIAFRAQGYGTPILIGREERVRETMARIGLPEATVAELEIHNARLSQHNERYIDFVWRRLQRQGLLQRDVARMVNQGRNIFAACMVAHGDADAMVTGLTRNFTTCFEEITRVIDPAPDHVPFGLSMLTVRGGTVLIADTTVHERPDPDLLVDIALQAAAKARSLGHEPRLAFVSSSNFGQPMREFTQRIRDAVTIMDARAKAGGVDFEYDGEMTAEVALDYALMKRLYPFARLSGPANLLIMPALNAANIGAKMIQKLAGASLIGPLLCGLQKPAQVVQMGATVNEIVTAAALAAYDALAQRR